MKRIAKLAGALLLGLPAAVLAHAALFGHAHVLAGIHHNEVVESASSLAAAVAVTIAVGCLLGTRRVQSGSILAACATAYLPGPLALALAALCWFTSLEALEGRGIGLAGLAAAVLCALLLTLLARAFVRTFAAITLRFTALQTRKREPAPVSLTEHRAPRATSRLAHTRRFARPPPAFA